MPTVNKKKKEMESESENLHSANQKLNEQSKVKILFRKLDHVVVTDFTSSKGHRVISVKEWQEKHPKMKPFLIANQVQCQRWVDASTPEEQEKVKKEIEQQNKNRIKLPSEVKKAHEIPRSVNEVMKQFNLPVQQTLFGDSLPDQLKKLER